MHDRSKWFTTNTMEIELTVKRFVNLPDNRDIVASHDMQPKDDLVDAGGRREDTLVRLVENHIDCLVEALQDADKVASVRGDDGYSCVDVWFEPGSHSMVSNKLFGIDLKTIICLIYNIGCKIFKRRDKLIKICNQVPPIHVTVEYSEYGRVI